MGSFFDKEETWKYIHVVFVKDQQILEVALILSGWLEYLHQKERESEGGREGERELVLIKIGNMRNALTLKLVLKKVCGELGLH